MAITIANLGQGQIGPSANTVYDLYTVPSTRAAMVKNMRFVNVDTATRAINVYYKKSGQTAQTVLPVNLLLNAGNLVIEENEITMGVGDKIQAKADGGNKIDYVISGIERDA